MSAAVKAPCDSGMSGGGIGLVRLLVLLHGGEDQRGIVRALRGRRHPLPVGERVRRIGDGARIVGQRALPAHGQASRRAAAVATVEDDGQMDALVQRGVEDAGHLAVAHVVATLVGVGGHQGAVHVDQLAVFVADGELFARGVDAQRAVAGVVEDDRVAGLRHIDEVLLHGREDAVAGGLVGRKDHRRRDGSCEERDW